MMSVAESVCGARVGAVLRRAIVDGDPLEMRQHPGVIDPLGATTIVQRIEGQRLGAGAVKPPPPSPGANASLVEMHDRGAGDLLMHPVGELALIISAVLDERPPRP